MEYFISVVRDNYINFDGRARRKEFWTFQLFSSIFGVFALFVDSSLGLIDTIGFNIIYTLIIFCPAVAVSIRRMHDINKSGWWLMLSIFVFPVIYLACKDSDIGDNDYGSSEKYPYSNDSGKDIIFDEEE
ncbi:DUF805 domain-containing protein [Candidatus Marinimicrobia bacterium]|nr:DUF805 domain-containing protein [Candidatus Neomarinimicrobiota bacterium]